MDKKATLIMGGGGFVGLNIVEHLLRGGGDVRIFDLNPPPAPAQEMLSALPGTLEIFTGDVRKPGDLAQAMQNVGNVVYGAAVTAGLERDRSDPERTMAVNLEGFLAALRTARDAGARRILNLSSAGAYGAAAFTGEGKLIEDDPTPDPRSIYSLTKFASERVADRMAEVWGIDTVSVRLSAVFGRWERRTGVRDTPSPQFQILEALLAGEAALIDRRDNRDWIYAPDVARAVEALLTAETLRHPLYNISSGQRWAVLDWGQAMATQIPGAVCRLAETGETPTVDLFSPSDRRPMSIARLQGATGFEARYDINHSVTDYLAWAHEIGPDYR